MSVDGTVGKTGSLFDGRYELLGPLGAGGMGIVLEARDERTGRTVALKCLRTRSVDPIDRSLFDREFEVLSALRVEGVPRVHERGEVDGQPYFTMDRVEAVPFDQWFRVRRPSAAGTAECLARAADRLDPIHRAGIVHGDVKPGNLLVDAGDEPWWIDFGLSSPAGAGGLEESTSVLGTLAYLAPERFAHPPVAPDARSDVYALGVILYHALVGRLPFDGDEDTDVIAAIEFDDPVSPEVASRGEIPHAMSKTILRALEKDPTRRFQSAREFARAIRRAMVGPAVAA